ncbi:hypothetical protein PG996_007985 [Apiospora saccharicola]|uniref:Uncharacterized protein n=1 Tax=Apiospora saccharicola TaxID=335842 RepID=A0ABR1UZV7_9PEZI
MDRQRAAGYIDNMLSPVHPMLDNAPVHYDSASGQFVQNTSTVATSGAGSDADFLSMIQPPPPRSEYTNLRAMTFWENMFSPAMQKFKSSVNVHKKRDAQYSIHNASDWDAVYTALELARSEYQEKGGVVGWWRRVRRKAADNVTPLQVMATMAGKMTPDDPFSTPVLGAVGMLFDAAKQAATARKKVAETFDGKGFENLIPIFSDVELFLGEMFCEDGNIHSASLDLTVTTLKAVDRTIGFYISNEFFRGSKAVFLRGDYEKQLLESLEEIGTKSKKLMEEAKKSHMREQHLYSIEGRVMMGTIQATVVHGYNNLHSLFNDHIREKDKVIEQKDTALAAANIYLFTEQAAAANERSMLLMVENERLRSASPAFLSAWPPPALIAPSYALSAPALIQAPQPQVKQDELQEILGRSDIDLDDMNFVFSKELEFPDRQRLQTEQIINKQLFSEWVVSASSSKLLVQWSGSARPKPIANLSPLSVFCAKFVQSLASQDRFISIQWFCGRHLGAGVGPHDMLVGMIVQLLRGYRSFDMQALCQSHDLPTILQSREQEQDTQGLVALLEWLVRALPRTLTLFCLVDGVVLYERREHWDAARPVLASLVDLADDPTIAATVKVLFTSTPGPPEVRGAFDEERRIINVETLPHLAAAPSDARFARQLGRELSH